MKQAAPERVASANDRALELSFVIPAYNEDAVLGRTLASIHDVVGGRTSYEIVLVDNGSADSTVAVAQQLGARTFIEPGISVAGLRNLGGRMSRGQVLVFLDADVVLTDAWGNTIDQKIHELRSNPRLLTGSWCGVPDHPSWIEKHWFQPLVNRPNSHINSGHLIISRAFFCELGGFDEELETGEDYEFSGRAVRGGGMVKEDPALAVVHHGYPQTLPAFVRREGWHGRSDFASPQNVLSSKIALATLVFAASHIAMLIGVLLRLPFVAGGSALMIALLCSLASLKRYGPTSPAHALATVTIYYFYFAGRTLALVNVLTGRTAFVHRTRR